MREVSDFGWWHENLFENTRDFNELELTITLDDPIGEEQTVAQKLKFLSCYGYGIHLTEKVLHRHWIYHQYLNNGQLNC